MLTINVKGIEAVQRKLAGLASGMEAKVLQPAMNKTAQKARAEINRAIPEVYNVKAADVRNSVSLRQAQKGNLEAVISVFGSPSRKGRSMNMVRFLNSLNVGGRSMKTRGGKGSKSDLKKIGNQLSFLVKRGSGLKTINGAFLGNKGRTVFRRTGKARLPIEPVQVIGFSQMFRSRAIETRVMNKIADDLPVEVSRALARLMA